jgi:hypothetical protein
MAESDVDSGPRLAVRSLRSKFEQMALDVSPNPQISHSRSPSGTLMLSEPGSPRPRAASSSMHAVPPDAHYLRATSSSSDLKVAGKRPPPPPPPPPRGSKAPPSPFGSPLLRPVPVPSFSPSTSTVSLDSSISTNSILASTNPSVLADYESPSTSPSRSVASLRNKFAYVFSPGASYATALTPVQHFTCLVTSEKPNAETESYRILSLLILRAKSAQRQSPIRPSSPAQARRAISLFPLTPHLLQPPRAISFSIPPQPSQPVYR